MTKGSKQPKSVWVIPHEYIRLMSAHQDMGIQPTFRSHEQQLGGVIQREYRYRTVKEYRAVSVYMFRCWYDSKGKRRG
jgi:hypothetical protein